MGRPQRVTVGGDIHKGPVMDVIEVETPTRGHTSSLSHASGGLEEIRLY